jgi:acyl-CoA synthetase (AMP-forming)/AMP-acid ligase II
MHTLVEPLEHARRNHPHRTAVIDGDRKLDYAQLHDRAMRLAGGLLKAGLEPGDRVALLAFNGHQFLEAFVGLPAAGLVLVPLNTRLAPAELQDIVVHSGARMLLCDRDPGVLADRVERTISLPDEYEQLVASSEPAAPAEVDESTLAAIFYTGGTTGHSKGVMLTHRNLTANAFHKTVACSLSVDDVFLAAPAMFHVAGIAPLISLVWLGGSSVTLPSFDPAACLDLIEQHRITVFMPVPTMLAALVAEQRKQPRDVSSLRMLGHAGSPIASELIIAARQVFPNAELAQFYGATETSSIVTCLRHEEDVIDTPLLGTCGRAVAGVAVRVMRDDGSECAPDEVGEIWVRGPNVTVGYWQDPEITAAALVDGWYRTGDMGRMREDGLLFVVDRIKDMIISGGENVYSVEVEDALAKHPAVLEAAVFGIPHPEWGEAVHAVVVAKGADASTADELAAELRRHCRERIAGYKVPKTIEVRGEPLPKSGPGKILKRVLREPHWRGRERVIG